MLMRASSPAPRPAARDGNNSDSKQDRQFIFIVFTVFFFAHSAPLDCAIGPLCTLFFFQGPTPFTCVWGSSLSDMDRPLSGWGYVLVLGPDSTTRGGEPGPVLVCDTPPAPPPPRVLRDSGLGAWC